MSSSELARIGPFELFLCAWYSWFPLYYYYYFDGTIHYAVVIAGKGIERNCFENYFYLDYCVGVITYTVYPQTIMTRTTHKGYKGRKQFP